MEKFLTAQHISLSPLSLPTQFYLDSNILSRCQTHSHLIRYYVNLDSYFRPLTQDDDQGANTLLLPNLQVVNVKHHSIARTYVRVPENVTDDASELKNYCSRTLLIRRTKGSASRLIS